jgi:hypothetical protein
MYQRICAQRSWPDDDSLQRFARKVLGWNSAREGRAPKSDRSEASGPEFMKQMRNTG